MPGRIRAGYIAQAVAEYVSEHTTHEVRSTGREATFINGTRANKDAVRRVHAWANESKLASLAVVDRFLIKHGLNIYEYEAWAEHRYGNNTYFDTDEIIDGMLAAARGQPELTQAA